MEEYDDDIEINLKKYKGHYRKFPWALIIRVIAAGVSVLIIFMLIKTVGEIKSKEQEIDLDEGIEVEIEY